MVEVPILGFESNRGLSDSIYADYRSFYGARRLLGRPH